MGGGKTVSTTAQQLANVSLQTSCYGAPIPIGYGQTRVSPNLIYYNDFKATAVTTETHSGKAGGGQTTTNTTFQYSATIIFALIQGQVSFGAVYRDKEQGTTASYGFTEFDGSRPQSAWSYMTSAHPGDAMSFNGLAYAAQANAPLSDQATLGNYSFELALPYSIAFGSPGYPDANAADYIPDFLTNQFYGCTGWTSAQIGDLSQYRDQITALGLWTSPLLTEQKTAIEHLQDWLTATNAEAICPGGVLQIIPYCDVSVTNNGVTYTPNVTPEYSLGPDDFIVQNPSDDLVQITRKSLRSTYNTIPVEFVDRALNYNTNTVQQSEPVDIDLFGERKGTTQSLHAINVKSIAEMVSLLLAQRDVYVRCTYQFVLGWRFIRLLPMDLVALTDPKQGLKARVVRITQVDEDDSGNLAFTAVDWPFDTATAAQNATTSSDVPSINQLVAPGNVNTPSIFDYPTYLTSTGGAAIGVAVSGGANFGGCQVFLSSDNTTYQYVGQFQLSGRYGTLTATFASGSPLDTTHTLSVDLSNSNGPQLGSIDATLNADFANLALVDNELVSYQDATLTSAAHYDLTTLYRGVLGTTIAAHSSGARFTRMDEKVLEIPITPARIGTTLYLKFCAFNVFGKSLQSLADVSPYTYVPNPGWNVSNSSANFTANGTVNGIAFMWGSNLLPGAYVVELWEGSAANSYHLGTATKIWEGNATGKLISKTDTTIRYYWLHPRAADGRYGALVPVDTAGLPAAASLVTSAIVLSATPGTATSSGAATSQTTNSVVIGITGGTGPFTYAWTWHAGGTSITITSSTSASTTFSATGLGLHETRSGTAQCVVTDSLSNTQTIFVNVSISETASAVAASASPTSLAVSGTSSTETTGSTTVTASGGLPSYTYAWTWQSGGSGITITSASAASTTFGATGMTAGVTLTGVALCTVTDALSQTATTTVSVSVARTSPLSVSATPTSLTSAGTTSSQTTGSTTATAAGGNPGYTYAWTWQTGGSGITINSASAAATSFTATGLGLPETRTGTALCTVTDSLSATATCTVSVSIGRTATTDTASMVAGFRAPSPPVFADFGYIGGTIGSYSPTGLTGGKTLGALYDERVSGGGAVTTLSISGFSSDPGRGWLTSINANSLTATGAGASSYSYFSGTGQWQWNDGSGVGFGFAGGTTYTVNVTHS